MKRLIMFCAVILGTAVMATTTDPWVNRPKVIKAVKMLTTEVGHLDKSLHNVGAPYHTTQKVHHLGQIAGRFFRDVQNACTYATAQSQMRHLQSDIDAVWNELSYHHYLLHYPSVEREWYATDTAFRLLVQEMRSPTDSLPLDADVEDRLKRVEDGHSDSQE